MRIAILRLRDQKKFGCDSFDDAKVAWREYFSDDMTAEIDLYPPQGTIGMIETFRFDEELREWVKSS